MEDLRIIFYGTAEFAVPSLEKIFENGFKPVAVVTAPDKPAGRGQALRPSPVKIAAEKLGIPVLQPRNMKKDEFFEEIKRINPDLQVIVAFRMMPERIWSFPRLGSLNLHSSLLPNYRGAAPIHWAIINGETETGVTTFFLKHEIDTGDLILQEKEPIKEEDTLGSLYERLKIRGANLLLKTLEQIRSGNLESHPQNESTALKAAPKIFKEDARIDWSASSKSIYDLVRGTNPFPIAWSEINGKRINILEVQLTAKDSIGPGLLDTDNKDFALMGCGDKMISLEVIQAEGGKKMKIKDFLNGNTL